MRPFLFYPPAFAKTPLRPGPSPLPIRKDGDFFAQIFQNFNVIISFAAYTARINRKGVTPVKYRHEWKHEITAFDVLCLRRRLSAVMQPDPHASNGRYLVRSLYFDDLRDQALQDKLNGVSRREKFRLRCYNGDDSYLVLEKKSKLGGLCAKEQARLTRPQAEALLQGNPAALQASPDPLVQELCAKMRTRGLRPKTIVDYTREPFVFSPGHVRVTLDYNIRTGLQSTDFFNFRCPTVPAGDAAAILEVKWDEYLPTVIRDLVQLPTTRSSAFSKYAACRVYG